MKIEKMVDFAGLDPVDFHWHPMYTDHVSLISAYRVKMEAFLTPEEGSELVRLLGNRGKFKITIEVDECPST